MPEYPSLLIRTTRIISELTQQVTARNVNIALPILEWTSHKINLAIAENERIKKCEASNKESHRPRHLNRGSIYYAYLGKNIGSEQGGYRPVLVVQSSDGNVSSNTTSVIPLTDAHKKDGSDKRLLKTHVKIVNSELKKESIIKAEHILSISKNRIIGDAICEIENMNAVELAIKICLGFQ